MLIFATPKENKGFVIAINKRKNGKPFISKEKNSSD